MNNRTKWCDTRLKNIFVSVRNGIWGDDPDDETDVLCVRGTDFNRITNRINNTKAPRRNIDPRVLRDHELQCGDLILEKSGGSTGQPVGSVALFDLPIRAVCSNFNARLQVDNNADPRFVCYLMNSLRWSGFTRQFIKQTTGIQNLDADEFLAQHCLMPPLDEQRHIADFLDAETARINDTISVIHKSSILLQVKRRVQLMSAFSDHNLPSARLGYYLDLVTSGPRGWGNYVGPQGTPFFRSANLRRDDIEPSLSDIALVDPPPSAAAEAARSRIRAGDVLVGITGANTCWVSFADERIAQSNVSQHVCLVRPGSMVDGHWLAYALSAPQVQELLLGSQYGGTKTQLSLGDIRDLIVPLPSLSRQRRIATIITDELAVIKSECALRDRQGSLLAERRQALITAAVTQQIDIATAGGVAV